MNTEKHGLEKIAPVEVVTAKESAAILKRCEEHIDTALKHLDRTEQMSNGLRGVIGVQMRIAKPYIPHGDYTAWLIANWPTLNYDTALSWMRLGDALIACETKNRSDRFFSELPKRLAQGEFNFDVEAKDAGEQAKQLMAGASIMDFIADNTERKPTGGSHQIKFTCPHCGAINKEKHGKKLQCVSCGKKITAVPDRKSDEAALAEQREAAEEHIKNLRGDLASLMSDTDETLDRVTPQSRKLLMADMVALGRHIEKHFKGKETK